GSMNPLSVAPAAAAYSKAFCSRPSRRWSSGRCHVDRFSYYVIAGLNPAIQSYAQGLVELPWIGVAGGGHAAGGVAIALGGRLDEGESRATIKKEGVFTPSLARSTCKRGLGSVEATGYRLLLRGRVIGEVLY